MSTSREREIVITGLGIVSPIGIGADRFWQALVTGESGIRPVDLFDASSLKVRFGGQIPDFNPKLYVRPRKSLKVMSREIQLGFAAADLAIQDSKISESDLNPDRFGVVFGNDMIYADLEDLEVTYRRSTADGPFNFLSWSEAIHEELHPLWLLKHLPNMTASHIAIAHDARGPNNSIVLGDVSGLLALCEAASMIRRGWADVMLVGGTGCRLHPTALVARGDSLLSHRTDDFTKACRPFDRDRDGLVNGEGAATIVLESREHAERRNANIRGKVLTTAARCESATLRTFTGKSLQLALEAILASTELTPNDIGHINAHGVGTIEMDSAEAGAISKVLGDTPVTAPKSSFGHLGAGGGVVELAASVLSIEHGLVPATLNYETPDPSCPVNVVHGQALDGRPPTAISINLCSTGQAVAVAIAR